MADVVYFQSGESFNLDEDHILIEPTRSGRYTANGSAARPGDPAFSIFYAPPVADDLASVLTEAMIWADKHLVPVIYVRGEPNERRGSEEVE